MNKNSLVICPVYNEEARIEEFYSRLTTCYFGDIIFIDDGSTDSCRSFFNKVKNKTTFVYSHSQRKGYGAALISGFKFALDNNYQRIITIDADLQHEPEQINLFLRELMEWEVVLGSRYININRSLDCPRSRLIINRYISSLIKLLFSTYFSDPFCGFRGYNQSFLKKINLKEQSYGVALEILLEIIRTKTYFREIPVEAIYFKDIRKFLDGLDNSRRRLLYYLEVIAREKKELSNEEKISLCKPSS
jgi:glycosyltransferase involved in cell wall biosynthesis